MREYSEDILNLLDRFLPAGAGYNHDRIDNNADSHLKAVLIGVSKTLPVVQGKLKLGTWQSIFLAELDVPGHRAVNLTILKIE
ncbi:MAG: secondary thiamine-phosphate synthase enzyme YjbQ [Euryarchaeota archaeon]|nr:secondary thiamine-phosphate synthase enzyme YjbQ [Euryarchaeota archaeon]